MRSTATTTLATVCEETLLTPRPLEQRGEKRDGAVGIALVIQRSHHRSVIMSVKKNCGKV